VPVFLAVGNDRQFEQLCHVLGDADLAKQPAFASAAGRSVHRADLRQQLIALMSTRDGEALVEQLGDKGVPCAPILDVPQALNHPHTAHRGMTVSMPGGYKGLASPIKLSRTPASYRLSPPADC
jgi:crotonobetainyl-CoA:carnitine CoA-transferase CaiB-like acyl-CoA transferase